MTPVIDFFVQLFNKLYYEGISRKEWSKSIIVPIYKKGDANIPDNHRGIALTSVLSKVYTHVLNKRLTRWAGQDEKILEQQAGFLRYMDSCKDIYKEIQNCISYL